MSDRTEDFVYFPGAVEQALRGASEKSPVLLVTGAQSPDSAPNRPQAAPPRVRNNQ
jgi:hypothetical protein